MANQTTVENQDKQTKLAEERKEQERLELQSDAIAKLYKNKHQINNENNIQL